MASAPELRFQRGWRYLKRAQTPTRTRSVRCGRRNSRTCRGNGMGRAGPADAKRPVSTLTDFPRGEPFRSRRCSCAGSGKSSPIVTTCSAGSFSPKEVRSKIPSRRSRRPSRPISWPAMVFPRQMCPIRSAHFSVRQRHRGRHYVAHRLSRYFTAFHDMEIPVLAWVHELFDGDRYPGWPIARRINLARCAKDHRPDPPGSTVLDRDLQARSPPACYDPLRR